MLRGHDDLCQILELVDRLAIAGDPVAAEVLPL
jgi:hypothetical protein